jgi:hypothetical protein
MWETLLERESKDLQPGDLAFFTRPGDPVVDPLTGPNGEAQEWHVMMVFDPVSRVLGSCPMLKGVYDSEIGDYLCRGEPPTRRWALLGHRRFPIPPSSTDNCPEEKTDLRFDGDRLVPPLGGQPVEVPGCGNSGEKNSQKR